MWVAMTVMVAEWTDRDKVAISATGRKEFKETETAPAHWKVWIGDYQRAHCKGRWVHNVLPISSKE
jgi:hypothetical protein